MKHNALKINILDNIQKNFDIMWCYSQNANICNKSNGQRYELIHMNPKFQDIKNSRHDADIKCYRELSEAIGRYDFYV